MNLKRVAGYFIRGCLVTAPLGITAFIVWEILAWIDRLLPFDIPGLGLLATVSLITIIGLFTSNVVGRSVLDLTESLLTRLPLVKLVYTSIKDLISAFVGDKRRFDAPVAVSLAGNNKVLGFVTRDGLARLGMPDYVAVYFPQSYNFAGYLMLVPRSQVEPLDLPSADVMTFIISGGVSGFGIGQSMIPQPRPAS